MLALRILVNRSAIGSVIDIVKPLEKLPAGLGDSGKHAEACFLSETDAAHAKLSQVPARTTAVVAAIVSAYRKFWTTSPLGNH